MAGDIVTRLRADPAPFEAGVKKMGEAVDAFVTAVEDGAGGADAAFADIIRQTVNLGTQMGRSKAEIVQDLGKIGLSADDATAAIAAIGRETDTLGTSAPSNLGKVERAARDAGDGVGNLHGKASTAGEGLRSLGDIARSAIGGDLAGAVQGGLDSLGGFAAAAGLGGAIGGAAASAVSGLVGALVAQWQTWQQTVNTTRDDLTKALLDSQGAFDQSAISSRIRGIVEDTDKWRAANLIAHATGRDINDVVAILAGTIGGADTLLQQWNENVGKMGDQAGFQTLNDVQARLVGVRDAFSEIGDKQSAVQGAMKVTADSTTDATQKYENLRQSLNTPLPAPPPLIAKVVVDVDDSAWNNWTPQQKRTQVYALPGGRYWE